MIIGHHKQKKLLSEMSRADSIPHAIIFEGPSQIGKKVVAINLIKDIFCASDVVCGGCPSCLSMDLHTHPDFSIIYPEKGQIKISQIRDLSKRFTLKAHSAPFKVVIIDDAHLMNKDSQNALLKTLEEPKGRSIIILITDYSESLLKTITSRSYKLKFFPVSNNLIKDYLVEKKCEEAILKEILLFSFGKPGLAIDFFSDFSKINLRKDKINNLISVIAPTSLFHNRFKYVKKLIENDEIEELLKIWLSYFRALMLNKILDSERGFYSLASIKKSLDEIEKSIHLISKTNSNKKIVLESLIIKL